MHTHNTPHIMWRFAYWHRAYLCHLSDCPYYSRSQSNGNTACDSLRSGTRVLDILMAI